ncbi:MAG: DUF3696 domain-containing protein [Treponema sp.]|nr:DUF3696 domain-containing protein [Treponema sp.]
MITELALNNFKCFDKQHTFHLSSINLLTGYNGRGKSSLIQSLLLLSQSMKRNPEMKSLYVNGDFINLDLFDDILYDSTKPVSFYIKTSDYDHNSFQMDYETDKNNDRAGKLSDLIIDNKSLLSHTGSIKQSGLIGSRQFDPIPVELLNKVFSNFYYVSADRLGPTKYEEKTELPIVNPIGASGQFKLNLLRNDNKLRESISKNIQYIMDSDDILDIVGIENEYSVLGLRFINKSNKKIKSFNTGFGYTYILAILLIINYVSEGCIFIENPEAHLHPLAQSRLIELIGDKVSSNKNLQVFIESHSEHIVNSIRLQVVETNRLLRNNDVKIYFFDKDYSIKNLEMNEKGQIQKWPVGFFDQQTIDLQNIIRLGLKHDS